MHTIGNMFFQLNGYGIPQIKGCPQFIIDVTNAEADVKWRNVSIVFQISIISHKAGHTIYFYQPASALP